jgi:uncharacterized sporulation protein YeaH/YhbH (DUF444 family)
MTRRIEEDFGDFRRVIRGLARRGLGKFLDRGTIYRLRAKGGRIGIPVDRIHIPHFIHGQQNDGVGRGPGKEGDVIGRDPQKGKGGNKAGDEHSEGIILQIDLDYVLKAIQADLELPNLRPKKNNFDEVRIKYNDISLHGPNSLRHMRRTFLKALQRLVASGQEEELHYIPGYAEGIRQVVPIRSDFRYRQYKEIRIPATNAVIFFARDCSISMNETKCDIVSDMSWWIDAWIRRFYKRTEHVYMVHDTEG